MCIWYYCFCIEPDVIRLRFKIGFCDVVQVLRPANAEIG